MNILTYLKNLLNSTSKKEDAKTTSDSSKSDKLKELQDYVKNQYGAYLPEKASTKEAPTYERYEYDAPSDDEITQTAKNELSSYVDEGEKSIRSEYDEKRKELASNKEASKQRYASGANELKTAYSAAAESLSNDALKRGLARSSIALNQQANASSAYTDKLSELISERNENVKKIDEELNGLEGQLQTALDSFKISAAAKLTQRINELKSEREENLQKAREYNNSLLKTEYEQSIQKEKTDSELYSEALSQAKKEKELLSSLSSDDKAKIEKSVYEKVVEVLDSLPFEEARELFLNEPIFRDSLSDYYYYTLYYKYR